MSLPETQQALQLIRRSHKTMLVVPENTSTDALSSMVALFLALQNDDNDHIHEISPHHIPTNLQFLPGSSQVMVKPLAQPEIILDIASPSGQTAQFHTTSLQGGVKLHISLPGHTNLTRDQIELSVRALPYDLVITFGAEDLENLGSLFSDYPDFFYNTPIINIDHRASNEHFGTVNLVDLTAGSIAEVTYSLIEALGPNTIDYQIATALYAGIIAGTDSFQKPSTTPRSFQIAAHLIQKEADREAVVQHLVKTKPLSLLKLTGRLYARLRYDEHAPMFWSLIRTHDFNESGASPADIPAAMHELSNNTAGYSALFIISEQSTGTYDLFLSLGPGLWRRSQDIQTELSAQRYHGLLRASLSAPSLEDAESQAIEQIRHILA